MLATVTTKGQVTLPKEIRDQLHIEQGTQLDFNLTDDGSILVRPLKKSALSIVGLLKSPDSRPVTIEEMNEAVLHTAAEDHRRSMPVRPGRSKKNDRA